MEAFVNHYPELVKMAKTVVLEAIRKQQQVVQEAAKTVQDLRDLDRNSPYTSIGSNAGQAEIAHNIEKARLSYEVGQHELIDQWSGAYLDYIKNSTDTYNFNSFETFSDVCAAVNERHLGRLITGHKFECKCQFFCQNTENPPSDDHFYIHGDVCCSWANEVHLTNIKSAVKTIGLIGIQDPDKLNIYPIPNKYQD